MSKALRARAAGALLLLAAPAAWGKEVPYLSGRVVDEAGIVPAETRARIEARLAALEQATGAQVAVLTVASLEDESLEDYSLRVAETWKLGRQGFDDGALLLVARDDRKMRLEVGYGLEPVLTDALSRRILDEVLRPRFRAGDFGAGIEAGVEAVAGVLGGAGEGALPEPPAEATGGIEDLGLLPRLGFFAFFLFVVGLFSLSAIFTQGCGAWMLYLFLVPFWFAFPMAILGPVAGIGLTALWLVGFPVLWILFNKTRRGRQLRKTSPWIRPFATAGGGSWSSGGGFSSGGFSGGGGSFGGGGASSSW